MPRRVPGVARMCSALGAARDAEALRGARCKATRPVCVRPTRPALPRRSGAKHPGRCGGEAMHHRLRRRRHLQLQHPGGAPCCAGRVASQGSLVRPPDAAVPAGPCRWLTVVACRCVRRTSSSTSWRRARRPPAWFPASRLWRVRQGGMGTAGGGGGGVAVAHSRHGQVLQVRPCVVAPARRPMHASCPSFPFASCAHRWPFSTPRGRRLPSDYVPELRPRDCLHPCHGLGCPGRLPLSVLDQASKRAGGR